MRQVRVWRGSGVALAMLALVVGCTGHQSSSTSQATPRHSAAQQAVHAFSPSAACARKVPGAQHVVQVTVGQVRRQGLGIIGPSPAVKSFAAGEAPSALAAYCYRWLPTRHLDEWWGVSASGPAVRIGAFGGETHDLGTFNGEAFD